MGKGCYPLGQLSTIATDEPQAALSKHLFIPLESCISLLETDLSPL